MRYPMNEAIAKAIDEKNAGLAGAIVDKLRSQGQTYHQVLSRVRTVRPGVTDSDWEDLMSEADDLDSQ
jgi:hypothetical protein